MERELQQKSSEEARKLLPSLLTDAQSGQTTIITRHGKSIAALVPLEALPARPQKSILGLRGSGKGLWGNDSQDQIRNLRDEWKS